MSDEKIDGPVTGTAMPVTMVLEPTDQAAAQPDESTVAVTALHDDTEVAGPEHETITAASAESAKPEASFIEPLAAHNSFVSSIRNTNLVFAISGIGLVIAALLALAYAAQNAALGDIFYVITTGASWLWFVLGGLFIIFALSAILLASLVARKHKLNYVSTKSWIDHRYGLVLKKGQINELIHHHQSIGGVTGWEKVKIDGYPDGVQIIHTKRGGYKLITVRDEEELELPLSRK
jgi:hypothetical protein